MIRKLHLSLLSLLFVSQLSADFIRAEVGAGAWLPNSSGTVQYDGTNLELDSLLGIEQTTAPYLWLNFKHFIPVIPNARVEILKLGLEGSENIAQSFSFAGHNFTYDTGKTNSQLNLDQYDMILYYNFLDNLLWLTLDIGAGVKYYDGYLNIENSKNGVEEKLDISLPIPILYARAGATLPGTNLAVFGDLKYFNAGGVADVELIDFRLMVDATLLELILIDLNVEAGYRIQRLMVDSTDNIFSDFEAKAKTQLDGFFLGLSLKF